MDLDVIDRTGLIRESYQIEGIRAEECRSIFLDWAMKLPHAIDPKIAIGALLSHYGEANPDHPMTQVLRDGLAEPEKARRRGGRRGRMDG